MSATQSLQATIEQRIGHLQNQAGVLAETQERRDALAALIAVSIASEAIFDTPALKGMGVHFNTVMEATMDQLLSDCAYRAFGCSALTDRANRQLRAGRDGGGFPGVAGEPAPVVSVAEERARRLVWLLATFPLPLANDLFDLWYPDPGGGPMSGTRRERMDADARERGLDFLTDTATGEAGGRLNAPEVEGDGGVWRANGFCLNQEQFNRLARMDGMLVDTAERACALLALIAASEALSQMEEVAAAFPPTLRAELGQHIEQLQAIYHLAGARAVVSDTISVQALNARFDFCFESEKEAAGIVRHYTPRPRR